jgi:hypothetical protein
MPVRILFFVLLLPLLQIIAWTLQEYVLKRHQNIVTGSLFISIILFTLITCLISLRRKGYYLKFGHSFLICLVILLPSLFISSFFIRMIQFGDYKLPAISVTRWLAFFGSMTVIAGIVAFLFRGDRSTGTSTDSLKRIAYVLFCVLIFAAIIGYLTIKLK